jgi:hypothetical protein
MNCFIWLVFDCSVVAREKQSCMTCGMTQKYASALSALVPKFDLGRFVRLELVRVRGQGF